MGFSQSAAMHFLPLIARLVLGAAFVTAGWNKIFTDADYVGPRAQKLIDLGIAPEPPAPASAESITGVEHLITLASLQTGSLRDKAIGAAPAPASPPASDPAPVPAPDQQPPPSEAASAAPVAPPATEPAPPTSSPATDTAATSVPAPDSTSMDDAATELPPPAAPELSVRARRLHSVTILAAAKAPWTFPSPVVQAWAVALLELVGGAMLLVGLFSRLWAFGLAIAMAILVSLTSLDRIADTLIFTMEPAEYNQLFCRLGLLTLALGVFMTGPGAMSVDRLLFRSRVVTIAPPATKP